MRLMCRRRYRKMFVGCSHSAGARGPPGDPSASHPLRKSGSITWAADYSLVPDLTVSGFNGSFHFHAKESITTLLGGSVVVV